MVEAGILAPVFAMMMMMTVHLGGTYQTKYTSFLRARNQVWLKASVGCTSGEALPGFGDEVPGGATSGGDNPGSKIDPGSSAQVSSGLWVASGSDTETWDYAPTSRLFAGPHKITTDSHVMCNEIPEGRNVFSYLWDTVKSFF